MTSPLTAQVKIKYSDLPAAWIDTAWTIIYCMLLGQTTNLARLKDHLPFVLDNDKARRTKPQSNYKRLTRFFEPLVERYPHYELRLRELLAELTLRILASDPQLRSKIGRILLLDGTEWKVRGSNIQFLTLAILFDGVAIPIAFVDLEKIGHSSQKERIAFFDQLTKSLDLKGMTLIADREYVGLQWFDALRLRFDLNYIVRLKKGIYHKQIDAVAGETQARMVAKMKRCKRKKIISKRIVLQGAAWYYIIIRNPKAGRPNEDEFIFLLSSWFDRQGAADAYALRWAIEVTFRHLKSNGFHLEDMRLEGRAKRQVVLAMLNVVFVLCVVEGRKFYQRNPRSCQTEMDYRTGYKTMVHSAFRQGLSRVMATFTSLVKFLRRLRQIYCREPLPDWAFV